MWVKRTPEEIATTKDERNRSRIRGSIFFGVFMFLSTLIINSSRWRSAPRLSFTSTDEMARRLPACILFAVFFGLLWFFLYKKKATVICPKCGKTKYEDDSQQCSCGGHFENIEEMKWEEHGK
jgi:ribosomal protein L37E